MKQINGIVLSLMLIIAVTGFSGCTNSTSPQTTTEHEHDHQHEGEHGQPHEHSEKETAANADFIQMGDYQFKLSPEIMKDGETHLDFFVHDKQHQHVKDVSGTFHVTLPDGSKETLTVEEEQPGNHYHGLLKLKQYGQVQVVAQITIQNEKYNPRFSFERKE
jgi:ABC-type nickel/cobalt efflux system permease component RcnA